MKMFTWEEVFSKSPTFIEKFASKLTMLPWAGPTWNALWPLRSPTSRISGLVPQAAAWTENLLSIQSASSQFRRWNSPSRLRFCKFLCWLNEYYILTNDFNHIFQFVLSFSGHSVVGSQSRLARSSDGHRWRPGRPCSIACFILTCSVPDALRCSFSSYEPPNPIPYVTWTSFGSLLISRHKSFSLAEWRPEWITPRSDKEHQGSSAVLRL
jgi:hypothetical protein